MAEPVGPAQWPLLALALVLSGFVRPSGAAVFVVLRYLHTVFDAAAWPLPALRVLCALRG